MKGIFQDVVVRLGAALSRLRLNEMGKNTATLITQISRTLKRMVLGAAETLPFVEEQPLVLLLGDDLLRAVVIDIRKSRVSLLWRA
jgi:hypothetical protein